MKRDLELAKHILAAVEKSNPFVRDPFSGGGLNVGDIAGHYDVESVSYHLVLLLEEGFLTRDTLHQGKWSGHKSAGQRGRLRLTWKGHNLLDELRLQDAAGNGELGPDASTGLTGLF